MMGYGVPLLWYQRIVKQVNAWAPTPSNTPAKIWSRCGSTSERQRTEGTEP
jgi:hypothetical protein